jgi:aspartate oxidase
MREVDCLILGLGAGGLSAGIEFIEESDSKSCLLLGSQLTNSSLSPWNMRKNNPEKLEEKMREGGDNLGNPELRETYIQNYGDALSFMEKIGLKFEESNLGIIPEEEQNALRKFHSHYKDLGGEIKKGTVKKLLKNSKDNITGVKTEEEKILCNKLIIAAGGMSNLFKYSSGFQSESLPNLLALCLEAGFEIDNLEFIMYHPFLVVDEKLPRALISGRILQNARFLNEENEEFLSKEIQDALRNNRHHNKFGKMTREFYRESLKSDITVDISEVDEQRFEKFKKENEYGWVFRGRSIEDVERFKINPTFHYSLGGLVTDKTAQTSEENVYAVGEISTGLHGSNRIGGTAIPEAVIFGRIAGEEAAKETSKTANEGLREIGNSNITNELREKFWSHIGPIRKTKDIEKLISDLDDKKSLCSEEKLLKRAAESILEREKNVGSHFIQ